jgi:hypothetical protein
MPQWVGEQENAISKNRLSFRGASETSEPGIYNHDREYGFRACAKRRIPE